MSRLDATHGEVSVDQLDLADELLGTGRVADPEVAAYAMRLGDDSLILSQNLGWWVSRAPELEEDMALANITLDLLGHARAFLHFAGTASNKSEDDLAFFRDEHEFVNCWLVEPPGHDFAELIARLFYFSAYQTDLYAALSNSSDTSLAAIAAKSEREVLYHYDHAVQWILRLGDGTEESRRRIIQALDDMWPYVDELFEDDELTTKLGDKAVLPSSLRASFDEKIAAVLGEVNIPVSTERAAAAQGRSGVHTNHMGYIIAEMQWLARRYPGAKW